MNTKDCFLTTQPYIEAIEGFQPLPKKTNVYKDKSGYTLEFVLNKHGYIDGEGWSFIIRVTDPRAADEYGVVDYNGQLSIDGEWVKRTLAHEVYKEIYSPLYSPTDKLVEEYDLWVPFLDEPHLNKIMLAISPYLSESILSWIENVKNKSITNDRSIS